MAYKMIAERENEKVNIERESRLWIVAKARVWASEGWNVVVTDNEGKSYGPADFRPRRLLLQQKVQCRLH